MVDINGRIPLRDYVDSRMLAVRDYVDARFGSLALAVDKAEAQMHERLAGMNEFREALKDQTKHYLTRAEHEQAVEFQRQRIAELTQRVWELEQAKADQGGRQAMLLTVITVGLAIFSLVLKFVV